MEIILQPKVDKHVKMNKTNKSSTQTPVNLYYSIVFVDHVIICSIKYRILHDTDRPSGHCGVNKNNFVKCMGFKSMPFVISKVNRKRKTALQSSYAMLFCVHCPLVLSISYKIQINSTGCSEVCVTSFNGAHFCVIASGKRNIFRNVTAVTSRWQNCAQFAGLGIKPQTFHSGHSANYPTQASRFL